MIKIENDCVGPCPMGCLGSSCPKKQVPYKYCDECGDCVDDLYEYDGQELCGNCLLIKYPKVEPRYD